MKKPSQDDSQDGQEYMILFLNEPGYLYVLPVIPRRLSWSRGD